MLNIRKTIEKAMARKQVSKIDEVREKKDGYTIHKTDGWSFYLKKKYGVVPHVGDEAIFYGTPFQRVQGIDVAGKEAFFMTQTELDEEHKALVKAIRKKALEKYQETMKRIKDDKQFETIDISGMSGSYEWGCQAMLQAGVKYLSEQPDFHFDYKGFKNVYGVCWTDTPWGKDLDKAITDAVSGDCTGAMHQAVIAHLIYIHKHGYGAWLKSVPLSRRYTYPNIPPPKN